jgi:hypothetical protein
MLLLLQILPMLLLLLLLILILPATVVAFLHSTINTATTRRICKINREHDVLLVVSRDNKLISTSIYGASVSLLQPDDYEINTSEEEDSVTSISIRSQINKLLKGKKKVLLSHTVEQLHNVHLPKSSNSIVPAAKDNEIIMRDIDTTTLTTDQMIKEVLLSSRFHMPFLHQTKVGPSTIKGAGRGLFAMVDINEGEIITCYPGDALLYEMISPSSSLDENDDDEVDDEEDDEEESDDDDDDDDDDEMVLWGTHVSDSDRWDDDTVFDGSETNPPLIDYVVSVDDQYSVMGHPALDDNPAYYGHYANDGAGHIALESSDNNIGVEENVAAYVRKSLEVTNAIHNSFEFRGFHVATVATRDIQAGDEILVTYGPDYWLMWS